MWWWRLGQMSSGGGVDSARASHPDGVCMMTVTVLLSSSASLPPMYIYIHVYDKAADLRRAITYCICSLAHSQESKKLQCVIEISLLDFLLILFQNNKEVYLPPLLEPLTFSVER